MLGMIGPEHNSVSEKVNNPGPGHYETINQVTS